MSATQTVHAFSEGKCVDCGTREALDYRCTTVAFLRLTVCEPSGDYPDCSELRKSELCGWCNAQREYRISS